jgi:hypothetical protein
MVRNRDERSVVLGQFSRFGEVIARDRAENDAGHKGGDEAIAAHGQRGEIGGQAEAEDGNLLRYFDRPLTVVGLRQQPAAAEAGQRSDEYG